jgi:cobaltochelatase CobN
MKQLAHAAQLAAQATDEVDNPVAHNTAAIARQLGAQGWRDDAALKAAQTRIFSGAAGSYGSGLDDAAVATDTWDGKDEGDRKMAELYLRKMQYAFGPDEADWGKSGAELAKVAGVDGAAAYRSNNRFNLYAAQLKGTEAAVLSRSSNLYGMLTTDDPFQYLGGISTAVRYLDGKVPELFISNLRGAGSGKAEEASAFLARELATREFHPGYIQGLMREGYAGTLQMLGSMNNFTGWTTVAREIVRDDQWQEFADVYVRDKHNLGLRQYMEQNNPHALAQMMERMLEMARQGYWQADAATVNELKDRYKDLAQRFDVRTSNETFQSFVGLTGYGLGRPVDGALATASSAPHLAATAPVRQPPTLQEQLEKLEEMLTPPQIKGMQLEKVMEQPVVQALGAMLMLAMGLLLVAPALGAWRQWRTA